MRLTPEQIQALITTGSALVTTVVDGIRRMVASAGASPEEQNAIIQGVIANSDRRADLAAADVEQAKRDQQG